MALRSLHKSCYAPWNSAGKVVWNASNSSASSVSRVWNGQNLEQKQGNTGYWHCSGISSFHFLAACCHKTCRIVFMFDIYLLCPQSASHWVEISLADPSPKLNSSSSWSGLERHMNWNLTVLVAACKIIQIKDKLGKLKQKNRDTTGSEPQIPGGWEGVGLGHLLREFFQAVPAWFFPELIHWNRLLLCSVALKCSFHGFAAKFSFLPCHLSCSKLKNLLKAGNLKPHCSSYFSTFPLCQNWVGENDCSVLCQFSIQSFSECSERFCFYFVSQIWGWIRLWVLYLKYFSFCLFGRSLTSMNEKGLIS